MEENLNNRYISIREGLASKPRLVPATTKLEEVISNINKDYYRSLYTYNENHKKFLEEKGTLSGITDTETNRLFFDFDDKQNIENAKQDTITTANRLLDKGFTEESIKVYFTGGKGFSIEVLIDEYISPDKFGAIVDNVAGDLNTLDLVVREANRIVRIPNTKHQSSGLYKIELTGEELVNLSVDEIKSLAKKPRLIRTEEVVVKLPEELKNVKVVEKKPEVVKDLSFDISTIDMKERPKGLDEARWLLTNGFFRSGERNTAMLCLAATYKSLKYPEELSFGILQGVAEIQSQRTGEETFPDKEIQLIIGQVYGPNWKGGTFTVREEDNWLAKYARKMGIVVKEENDAPQTLDGIHSTFETFVRDIEKNTIKTSIESLDKVFPITVGSNVGIVAAAGAGKTSIALKILKHNSEQGILTVFASLDMTKTRLFEKVLYNVSGLSREDLYKAFKEGKGRELTDMVKKHYGNVWFYDKSAATVSDIRNYVLAVEQKTGQKVRVVMIDYFERLNSDVSDDTASSKKVAGEIQDMVNDLQVAAITLVQPNKMSLGGGPDTEIKSYTAIKGSSFLYQSFRGIIALSRPFYTPSTKEFDKFAIINVVKNDLGELDRLELGWNGKRGDIFELEDAERQELRELLKQKNAVKDDKGWE
jgi:hypothetical protein